MGTLRQESVDFIKSIQDHIRKVYASKCISGLIGDERSKAERNLAKNAENFGNRKLHDKLNRKDWYVTICSIDTGDVNKSEFYIQVKTDVDVVFMADVKISREDRLSGETHERVQIQKSI